MSSISAVAVRLAEAALEGPKDPVREGVKAASGDKRHEKNGYRHDGSGRERPKQRPCTSDSRLQTSAALAPLAPEEDRHRGRDRDDEVQYIHHSAALAQHRHQRHDQADNNRLFPARENRCCRSSTSAS